MTDASTLYAALVAMLSVLGVGWLVYGLTRASRRVVGGWDLAWPLAAAATARMFVGGVVTAFPSLHGLRGSDDGVFIHQANGLVDGTFALSGIRGLLGNLQVFVASLEIRLVGDAGDFYLRAGQISIAVAGIALAATAVTHLAGRRGGVIAAWIMALEPSGVFFSGLVHKESLIYLSEGIVILGAVRMYARRDGRSAALLALGVGTALVTRPYVGAMLGLASVCVSVHASLRVIGDPPRRRRLPALGLISLTLLTGFAVSSFIVSPSKVLSQLQSSQNFNATNEGAHLRLPPIDYSSWAAVATNAWRRGLDVMLRPFPWETSTANQRAGAAATVTAWILLATILVLLVLGSRTAFRRLVPLAYIFAFLLLAYALSTGNAGTGFRYRSGLLFVLAAGIGVLVTSRRDPVCGPTDDPIR